MNIVNDHQEYFCVEKVVWKKGTGKNPDGPQSGNTTWGRVVENHPTITGLNYIHISLLILNFSLQKFHLKIFIFSF